MGNSELLEALNILEREKNISKETLLEAIENSLITACKNHFGKSENVKVSIDPDTCEYHVFQEKTVVEQVEDAVEQISVVNAKMIDSKYEVGDIVNIEVESKEFGRIATQNAKNAVSRKSVRKNARYYLTNITARRRMLSPEWYSVISEETSASILERWTPFLTENEQVKGEIFQPTERIKLYVLEVKATSKGPKILVSRTHPELVKRLLNLR